MIVFSGLPGTGKSAIAESVAEALGVPVFAKDWLEATLRLAGLAQRVECIDRLGYAGYELLTTLARRQLMLGQSAILDSVASLERIRAGWRDLAAAHGAAWRAIECTCSDEALHRARLAVRRRGIPGWHELEWDDVERVRGYFEPWDEPRLVLDAAAPLEQNVARALAYLQNGDGRTSR